MSKKRLILHIGAHKTGTTALQVFFSQHADQLRQAGVEYPYRESVSRIGSGKCAGNLACLLEQMGSIENGRARFDGQYCKAIDQLVESTLASDCQAVLFSGEIFCESPEGMVKYLASRCNELEVSIVLSVRDPFDFTLSMWKQRVKRNAETRDLSRYVLETCQARTLEMFTGFEYFSRYFSDLRLVNYDHCKNDIFSSFLQAAGIDATKIQATQANRRRFANASLTHSQAQLITQINQQHGECNFAQTLIDYLIRHAPPRRENFYSEALHRAVLQAYASEVTAINALLPAERQLATSVREGQTTDTGIQPEDMALVDDFLFRARQLRPAIGLLQRARNILLRRRLKKLPINFDPQGYRLLNPDLPVDTELYRHYCSIGLAESRPYRIKLQK